MNKLLVNMRKLLLTFSTSKAMQSINNNVIISIILLLPASIFIENIDGLDVVNDFYGAMREWLGAIIVSLIIATISWGVYFLFNKKSLFVKAFYKSCYLFTIVSFSSYFIGYLIGVIFY